MSLIIINEDKFPNASPQEKWSQRGINWSETGPAHDTWGHPGIAFTKSSKNNLGISNENKTSAVKTWDQYTTSYDNSLPDTWDTQYGFTITNETKN